MKIEVRAVGDVEIMDISGKITLGEGTMAMRNTVRDLMKAERKKIILNLKEVVYVDSSGIGEIVSAYTAISNQGGRLVLLNLHHKIIELLKITKLLTVFHVYDDEKAALDSF